MTDPVRAEVDEETRQALARLSAGDAGLLAETPGRRQAWLERSGLDTRSFHLIKIAALVALDTPRASYTAQVRNALTAGVSPREILGVLLAVTPEVGGPRVVTAAPEIVRALRRRLSEGPLDRDSTV